MKTAETQSDPINDDITEGKTSESKFPEGKMRALYCYPKRNGKTVAMVTKMVYECVRLNAKHLEVTFIDVDANTERLRAERAEARIMTLEAALEQAIDQMERDHDPPRTGLDGHPALFRKLRAALAGGNGE